MRKIEVCIIQQQYFKVELLFTIYNADDIQKHIIIFNMQKLKTSKNLNTEKKFRLFIIKINYDVYNKRSVNE